MEKEKGKAIEYQPPKLISLKDEGVFSSYAGQFSSSSCYSSGSMFYSGCSNGIENVYGYCNPSGNGVP